MNHPQQGDIKFCKYRVYLEANDNLLLLKENIERLR